jgi:hypothetical protein
MYIIILLFNGDCFMLGVCMRSKLKEEIWRSLVQNSAQKPIFEYIDWGLHYDNKSLEKCLKIGTLILLLH